MGADYPRGLLPDPAGQAGKVLQVDSGDDPTWVDPASTLPPSGPAGGVLAGDYPAPSFAVDMATQAELDAERVRAEGEEDLKLNIADGRVPPAPTASGLWLKDAGGGLAWTGITQGDVAGLSAALTARALASDLTAEVSRAEAAEALLAPLTDPHLLGNPTAPTPPPGDNDTSIATSAFVAAALAAAIATASIPEADVAGLISDLAAKAPLASPAFTGTPTVPTVAGSTDSTTKAASTAFVQAVIAALTESSIASLVTDLAAKAPLASPTLTGDPHAPDQADADNDQSIANTKFVQRAIALLALGTASTHPATDFDVAGAAATEQTRALAAEALLAPKASPALTGHPTGVTETPGDNSTRLASTAYADAIAALKLSLVGGTMSGPIDMGTSKVTGVGDPSAAQDAATKNYVDTVRFRIGGPYSGYSFDPHNGLAAVATWPVASRGFFVKPQGLKKVGCTKLVVMPAVASGNLNVAVYAQSGSGLSLVPSGNALVSSGSTPVGSANTPQEVPISATDIDPELHWLFMIVDNITASFSRATVNNNGIIVGLLYSYVGASVTVPSTGFALSASATYMPWIGYE